jgi:hypothetical protein
MEGAGVAIAVCPFLNRNDKITQQDSRDEVMPQADNAADCFIILFENDNFSKLEMGQSQNNPFTNLQPHVMILLA